MCPFSKDQLVHGSEGTPAFQSPEIAKGLGTSGPQIDLWAAGVTLYNMLSGKYPFHGSNVFSLFENIVHCDIPVLTVDPMISSLLREMLDIDISRRKNIFQILQSDWMQVEYDKCEIEFECKQTTVMATLEDAYGWEKPKRRRCNLL